ncbi:GNAT family N-acetyltransferase [Fluoribacter gormanii]|uniref:GNAT family N-acetyltransferase n=1 Tax=Fluoribacter gormanii TaxID=464 RepID=UPI0010419257|nr:GNAT family N-acetyltransferase [Fluoribacter gormanii]
MNNVVLCSDISGLIEISISFGSYTISTPGLVIKSINQIPFRLLIDSFYSLLSNKENLEFFGDGIPWSKRRVESYLYYEVLKWHNSNLFGIFSAYEKENYDFVGYLDTHRLLATYASLGHKNVVEMGYIVGKGYWGKGFGTIIADAGQAYIRHIANNYCNFPPEEIVATVHPLNKASVRILEKTLSMREDKVIFKFGGRPRFLFYTIL